MWHNQSLFQTTKNGRKPLKISENIFKYSIFCYSIFLGNRELIPCSHFPEMKKDITQAIYFPDQLSRPSKNKYQY
jgi:hypothetical protein